MEEAYTYAELQEAKKKQKQSFVERNIIYGFTQEGQVEFDKCITWDDIFARKKQKYIA
ncbi:hypothetical protein FACS189474_3070 [Bacteroidia bacterium]|nr:hypothetical protein FACS189474_3070 [Bacteroidia bacterium]